MLFFNNEIFNLMNELKKEIEDCLKEDKNIVVSKHNNKAPKNMQGDYDLSIYDNKIVLVDNKDGTTVETKCHPEDNFNIGIGIIESFKKMYNQKYINQENQQIKLGDMVEIIEPACALTTSTNFFNNNQLLNYAVRYRYGVIPIKHTIGKVVKIIDHYYMIEVEKDKNFGEPEYDNLTCYKSIYIVADKGLKKINEIK